MKLALFCLLFSQAATTPTVRTLDLVGTQQFAATVAEPRIIVRGNGPNGTDRTGPIALFGYGAKDGFALGAARADAERYKNGGEISHVRIARQGTGGTALSYEAVNGGERPGEVEIDNVIVCGFSDLGSSLTRDNWERGLLLNGGTHPDLVKVNGRGLRRFSVRRIRVSGCLGNSIELDNVANFFGDDIQVERGKSTRAVPNVVIRNSLHLFLSRQNIFGEVHVEGVQNLIWDGYAQTVYIDKECSGIVLRGIIDTLFVEDGATGRCDAFVRKAANKSVDFSVN